MAVAIEEEILRFQVAVDDVLGVQVVEGADDLARIEITCQSQSISSQKALCFQTFTKALILRAHQKT